MQNFGKIMSCIEIVNVLTGSVLAMINDHIWRVLHFDLYYTTGKKKVHTRIEVVLLHVYGYYLFSDPPVWFFFRINP